MTYRGNGKPQAKLYRRERDLILSGLSYTEVSQRTGERAKTISERNRLIHKVDIWGAFEARIRREGLPRRLPDNDAMNGWVTGFVDGEGSFVVFTRPCTGRPQYHEFRLGLRITVRSDDLPAIRILANYLGVGRIHDHPARGKTRASVSWVCEKVKDLTEVLVPLFESVPLRTKKAAEFILWAPLVRQRYIDTLGGRSNRKAVHEDYKCIFEKTAKSLRDSRSAGRI